MGFDGSRFSVLPRLGMPTHPRPDPHASAPGRSIRRGGCASAPPLHRAHRDRSAQAFEQRPTPGSGRHPWWAKTEDASELAASPLQRRDVRLRGAVADIDSATPRHRSAGSFSPSTTTSVPCAAMSDTRVPVVRAGGLRVVVAANSFARGEAPQARDRQRGARTPPGAAFRSARADAGRRTGRARRRAHSTRGGRTPTGGSRRTP